MKCGCKIVIDQKALKKYGYLGIKDKEMQISFCPLHSAAKELHSLAYWAYQDCISNHGIGPKERAWIKRYNKLFDKIAKARGH